MRLSISNIAWDVGEDVAVADLLGRCAVDAIDIAPGKYFPQPDRASDDEISRIRTWWQTRGIDIVGMQALLFGTQGLNLFGPPAVQQAMLDHLAAVCRIGAGLGATRLVFGSPRNRDRSGLADDEALRMATDFFGRLGDIAADQGVVLCLEPNPPRYGANFMTTSAETAAVVARVANAAIRMQLDTGALAINGEDPGVVLACHAALIGHVHASEPDLVPLGDGSTDHRAIGALLRQQLPDHVVTIEMLATTGEAHPVAIERALQAAIAAYRTLPGVER